MSTARPEWARRERRFAPIFGHTHFRPNEFTITEKIVVGFSSTMLGWIQTNIFFISCFWPICSLKIQYLAKNAKDWSKPTKKNMLTWIPTNKDRFRSFILKNSWKEPFFCFNSSQIFFLDWFWPRFWPIYSIFLLVIAFLYSRLVKN